MTSAAPMLLEVGAVLDFGERRARVIAIDWLVDPPQIEVEVLDEGEEQADGPAKTT